MAGSGAGSGGSAGYQSVQQYQGNIHALLLSGYGVGATGVPDPLVYWSAAAGSYYSGGAFADNPSALRFIAERGLTDVGGNPYEGVSAFEADDTLDTIDEGLATFRENIDALVPDTDFAADITDAETEHDTAIAVHDFSNDVVAAKIEHDATITSHDFSGDIAAAKVEHGATITPYDFSTDIADAKVEHDATMQEIDFNAEISNIISRISVMAGSEASTSLMKAIQDAKEQLPDIITRARSNAAVVNSDSIYTTLSHVRSVLDTALDNYATHDKATADVVDARSDFEPAIDSLYTLATNIASIGASKLITTAYTSALSMVEGSVIDKAVSSYEKKARTNHLRGVSRFAGGMSDINAVQSSSFVIGLALLESDFSTDVNAHRSELTIQVYTDAVAAFINVNAQMLTEYLKLYVQEVLMQADVYKSIRGLKVNDLQIFSDLVRTFTTEQNKLYTAEKTTEIDTVKALNEQQSNTFLAGFGGYLESLVRTRVAEHDRMANFVLARTTDKTKTDLAEGDRTVNFVLARTDEQAKIRAAENDRRSSFVLARTSEKARTDTLEKDRKVRFVLAGAESISARRSQISSFYRENAVLMDEINKTRIVAKAEEFEKNLEYDVKAAMWDMNLFQHAGNILGGVTGAVVPNVEEPSRMQTALSAGLGAAGIGATAGGIPGAIGLGLAGMIAGYQQ